MMLRNTLRCLCWWSVLMAIWLLLVDSLQIVELLAGACAAGVATFAVIAVSRSAPPLAMAGIPWKKVPGIPMRAVQDSITVLGALLCQITSGRRAHGRFILIPFEPGGPEPLSAGRRALVQAAVSVPPNTVAVGVDHAHKFLIVHQLVPTSKSIGGSNREWPL